MEQLRVLLENDHVKHAYTLNLDSYKALLELINKGHKDILNIDTIEYTYNISMENNSYNDLLESKQECYNEEKVQAVITPLVKPSLNLSIVWDVDYGEPLYCADGSLFTIDGYVLYVIPVKTTDYE